MIYLNEESLRYAIAICRWRRNYEVGIALYSLRRTHELRDMIGHILCTDVYDDIMVTNSEPLLRILFKNGSSIRVVPSPDATRGCRVHLLIMDDEIRDINYINAYRRIECLEDFMERRKERKIMDNPLFNPYYDRRIFGMGYNMEFKNVEFKMDKESNKDHEYEEISEEALVKILSA